MYYDLGKETFSVTANPNGVDGDTRGSTVRIGVNLHLNPVRREVTPIK
jgi:opacity protein-like surface antigen